MALNLIMFLQGSKKAKIALKEKEIVQYQYFEEIWNVRNDHFFSGYPCYMYVTNLPCIHLLFKKGKPSKELKWFESGPNMNWIPLPIKDPNRHWGGPCEECKGCIVRDTT